MAKKAKISIMIPCYNEEENVRPIYAAVKAVLTQKLPQYAYEILFIDNKSTDKTRVILTEICAEDADVKAIFNMKNFGQFSSPYYGLCQTTGDCTILICADFQDPVDMIVQFVAEWEKGAKVVCAIKTTSKENGMMYFLRSLYYKTIKRMSDVEQIEHFTGFGLYDKSFLDVLRTLDDPTPFLRGIVAEYAPDHKEIYYEQQERRAGKTHNNWYSLYDAAMLSFTSYTKIGLRIATIFGFIISGVSFLVALSYLVMKLIYWDRFIAGAAPMLIGVFLMGGIQLFFIGLIGEYILNMNTRILNRPLVIEEKRLNFEQPTSGTDAAENAAKPS
ncbi:MAG: glycosyltransferase family 2 protein [Ruthenibacterium sp.]